MYALRDKPSTSTTKQHRKLICAARQVGINVDQLRQMVGGSLRNLSAKQASMLIQRFTGEALPNPPGEKPHSYARRPHDTIRIIAADHIEQIDRLGALYFCDADRYRQWLKKNFKVVYPDQLLTAERACEVIYVLKTMIERRKDS